MIFKYYDLHKKREGKNTKKIIEGGGGSERESPSSSSLRHREDSIMDNSHLNHSGLLHNEELH